MISPFDLNLRHLEAAIAIDRLGGVGAAAVFANLSQPAVTQALAKIEALLDHRLFDRHPSGAQATAAGRLFLTRADAALRHVVEGVRAARRNARLPAIAHVERAISMNQLRMLDALEAAANYSLAARRLAVSQPAVYKSVRELELALSLQLVVREHGAIRTTPNGRRLVRAIRLATSELGAGVDELQALRVKGAGRILVGSLPLPKALLLPKALSAFTSDHRRATIRVIEGGYEELLNALMEGEIDFLLGALRSDLPGKDFAQLPLFTYDLSIVGRSGHPLARKKNPTPSDLADFPWIVSAADAPMRQQWEALFRDVSLPETRIEASSILTARQLLLEQNWLTLLSRDQFRVEEEAGILVAIGEPLRDSMRQIGVTTRKDWRPTQAQRSFLSHLESCGRIYLQRDHRES